VFRPGIVYLDNNATTEMPGAVRREMDLWTNRGNPSAGYASARAARRMMSNFRNYIGGIIGAEICCDEDRDSNAIDNAEMRADATRFKIIITSGASEANAMAVTGVVSEAAKRMSIAKPNIVVSAVEHKSIIACANGLRDQGRATVTMVPADVAGRISPEAVAAAIGVNTCIVCVMAANNETGAINDIAAIGAICRSRGVHYHCDGVQAFGRMPPRACCFDSLAVSFHKLHGPPGVGVLFGRAACLLAH
jgi:cysteine desulfurase